MSEQGTHSYYDWQISTLMLAYDVVEPLSRTDHAAIGAREEQVRRELHAMVESVLPRSYLENPEAEFPPQVVSLLTRATIQRAHEILAGRTRAGG